MVRHRIVQKPITLTTGLTPFFLYSTLNSGTLTPPVPPTNQSSTVRNPGISLTWTRREVPPICGARLGHVGGRCHGPWAVFSAVETRPEASVTTIVTPATRWVLLTCTARVNIHTPRRCNRHTHTRARQSHTSWWAPPKSSQKILHT